MGYVGEAPPHLERGRRGRVSGAQKVLQPGQPPVWSRPLPGDRALRKYGSGWGGRIPEEKSWLMVSLRGPGKIHQILKINFSWLNIFAPRLRDVIPGKGGTNIESTADMFQNKLSKQTRVSGPIPSKRRRRAPTTWIWLWHWSQLPPRAISWHPLRVGASKLGMASCSSFRIFNFR